VRHQHILVGLGGGARVLFTTRQGGFSRGPYTSLNLGRSDPAQETDKPAAVAANREHVAALAGAPLRIGRQVHGTHVARDGDPDGEADGQATADPGVAATVLVADCLPIAIAGEGALAMVHAGWRGLAGGVLAEAVRAVRDLGATEPLRAAIGPGIGSCCFEVGDEVREAFGDFPQARRGRRLDLKDIAGRTLEDAGVTDVDDVGLCTACDAERFFSHRRDGERTGRQAGIAWLSG